jgi:hypothetical protein
MDKILLRKRSLIETVNDQLKNISQIEHSRHRSVWNFMVNLFSGLIAYTYLPKKPSRLSRTERITCFAICPFLISSNSRRTYKTDYFPRLLKPDFRASDLVA